MFNKRNKKAIRVVWMVLSIIIILGMVLLYMPIFQ